MKKGLLAIAIAIMMGFASSGLLAQGGPGYGGYGPGYGMGPGMMGGYGGYGGGYGPGWGMGPGMMWGYGGYGPGYGPQYQQPYGRAVNKAEATEIMNNVLSSLRNPNLKLGNIKDESNAFEADVLTRKGNDLVNKIFVDKQTGRVSFAY
jgi:hypothetical protein